MKRKANKRNRTIQVTLIMGLMAITPVLSAQDTSIRASTHYRHSGLYQLLWGRHYRKEWGTPVKTPLMYLDTAFGGLTPYQDGGGRQSKTLRLHDKQGREYVMRSVDKTFGAALPANYQNTFVEKLVDDQVSLGHPYAALTVPTLAEAAKIYHASPRLVFIPYQRALDTFNIGYGDRLYLIEQRPDEDWSIAANFGNAKKIVGTGKMLEDLLEDNDNRVDQLLYVRSRLLDMLIGDGSRHEDQWRWGKFKNDDETIFKPIPRDRDQAFARFDGLLVNAILSAGDINHLQTFKYHIPDVRTNNFPSRNLDRRVTNAVSKEEWVATAKELQALLTDEVIENAIHQLPPEIFPISGEEMIAKLKSRRADLPQYAETYYTFLAKEVEVVGSEKNELFQVRRHENGQTLVEVFKIKKNGSIATLPYYRRSFHLHETKEIRLYGIAGHDTYRVEGSGDNAILVRIIGGPGRDSIVDRSRIKVGESKTLVYDDHANDIVRSKETKLHLSKDSAIHAYKYDAFRYNYEHLKPVLFYSFEDKLYVGLQLKLMRHGWRKEPYKSQQRLQANYSIAQKDFSFEHQADFNKLFGQWSMALQSNYDRQLWTNFFGLGNETLDEKNPADYYQLRSQNINVGAAVYRNISDHVRVEAGPVYNMVKLLEDTARFVFKQMPSPSVSYDAKHFAGAQARFAFTDVDNRAVPSKGYHFSASAQYLQNLQESRNLLRVDAQAQLYATLFPNMILALRPAFATVAGEPEFYQHVSMGGSNTLRGYSRDRFWGTTSFYSDNELQYRFIHGRYGLTAFYDIGRVWLKGESSSTWHTGYGGGIVVAPFNKAMISVTYGMAKEGNHIHVRLYRSL